MSWTPPNATYDSVVLNCAGLDLANNDTVNITEHNSNGTCVELTPGALYNITLSTTLNNNSAPPATTDIFQNVTRKSFFYLICPLLVLNFSLSATAFTLLFLNFPCQLCIVFILFYLSSFSSRFCSRCFPSFVLCLFIKIVISQP